MSSAAAGPQIDPQPLEPGPPSARTRWIDLSLVLLVGFAEAILFAIYRLLYPSNSTSPVPSSVIGIIDLLLQDGIAFLMLAYVLSRQKRGPGSIGIGFRWSDPFKGVGLWILGVIVVMAFRYVIKSIDYALGIAPDSRSVTHAGWKERSITDLLNDISSPIVEEVLVRGYLMTEMIQLGKPLGAAIMASVVFQTSYHLYYGWGTAISLSGFFLVLAVYFANSKRLAPVICAHLFWDLIAYFIH
jgi:uncharacterized protein